MITVNDFQPLTLITKSSILDVAAVLHSSLLSISLGLYCQKNVVRGEEGDVEKYIKGGHVRIGWVVYRRGFKSPAQYVICPNIGFLLASNISFKTSQ